MTPVTPRTVRSYLAHRARRIRGHLEWRLDPVRDVFDRDRSRYYPSDPDDLTRYRARFVDSARLFELFVRRCGDVRPGTSGPHVGVVVTPWFGTPSPWYAIAVGLALARKGRRVTFLWHDLPFTEQASFFDLQTTEIRRVLRVLARRFPVVRVSAQPPDGRPGADDDAVIRDLADQNLVWATRAAITLEAHEEQLAHDMATKLRAALPRVRSAVRDAHLDSLVVCGGVLAASGLYLHTAAEVGARAATFDAGIGWTNVGTQGVSAHLDDLARAFTMLPDEPGGTGDGVYDLAREELSRRRVGEDATSYQHAESKRGAHWGDTCILVPLSVMFDTAALGRHHIFADSSEWLLETVATLLAHTDDPVVVRQHPSERRASERSRFDAGRILSDAFGSDPRVRFIPADDPTNTYELLDAARLVVPFVSTIGIEAAALGKPVVLGGSVYYAPLGFAWAPATRAEYVETLERGARGTLPELPGQRHLAWRCYYVNAVCQRVFTDFTCQPPDFWRWVRRRPAELFDDPDVDDIVTAIGDDVPLPILRHRRQAGRG